MKLHVLRWLLLVPSMVVGWYLALFIGLLLLSALDSMCPADQMISGMCVATWYGPIEKVVFCFGASSAAALVLIAAHVVAPSHKIQINWATLVTGGAIAIWFGYGLRAWLELACTLVVASICAVLLSKRSQMLVPNNSFESDASKTTRASS